MIVIVALHVREDREAQFVAFADLVHRAEYIMPRG